MDDFRRVSGSYYIVDCLFGSNKKALFVVAHDVVKAENHPISYFMSFRADVFLSNNFVQWIVSEIRLLFQ